MLLVIGGIASGKRTYLRELGYPDGQVGETLASRTPVLYGLEEILRAGPLDDAAYAALCAREAVVCCEVGLGVVPMDAGERAWRELVGRTCAKLATDADTVVRMVCGIPVTLKAPASAPSS